MAAAAHLARRAIERWAARLARWLDRQGDVPEENQNFGPALRLFGLGRLRDSQLPVVQSRSGRSIDFGRQSNRLWQDAMLTVREALGSLTPPLKFARAFVCLPTTCLKKSARMLVDLTTLSLPAAFTRFSA
jgi:hypothetical protein